ncbi:alpha/beta hydrolase [Parasphingorhabdus sp. JC815]|uniref:alpha/beta fold hydrolase n=1 Tax=Parasphingorhabdus sp. JC815 TaxID=3232140 RepID=UPI00345865EA
MNMVGPASQSYFSQRLRLRYVDWGNADKPPLILLHGGKDHCRNWDWVAQELCNDWHIIAPDIRGHGDSQWSTDGNYGIMAMVTDLAQLIHQLDLSPVSIVAHSMGGNIALRYTGLYPDTVRRLVAIEGLGPGPEMLAEREEVGQLQRLRNSIEEKRNAAGRQVKRYATFDDALKRMQEANGHLSDEQARHLTTYAVIRNEDGSYSWKFDPYVQHWDSVDLQQSDIHKLWGNITCPTQLHYGDDSWASNPEKDGRMKHFGDNVSVKTFANAGHWLHHDQFDQFVGELKAFL